MTSKRSSKRNFLASEKGTAAIEMAFVLPVMLLMLLPVYDYFRYILLQQKLQKMVATMGDMVALSQPATGSSMATTTTTAQDAQENNFLLTRTRLSFIMNTAPRIMDPVAFPNSPIDGFTVSSILKANNNITQPWIATFGAGGFNYVNTPGAPATTAAALPNGFTGAMYDNENVIAVIGSAQYRPLLNLGVFGITGFGPRQINAAAFYPSRGGPLLFVWG